VLVDAWEKVAEVKPRTVTETRYVAKALESFLGHSDAGRITRDDMQRWRDAMKDKGLTNNAWNNRLSMLRQVFERGVADKLIPANPADNVLRLRKSRPQQQRLPYSDDEAARILTAARGETRPALRWAHWVMAFTGMRVGEVLQLTGGDIRQDGKVWYIAVHEDDEGKSVKTGQRRNVPIHSALIREGFLGYAQTILPDAPLFPDKKLDRHGLRGGRGWNAVGRWVRKVVGITDAQKAPNHSWRHRLEDELRTAEVPEYVRDAITGHARKTTGRQYGVRGEALRRLSEGLERVPAPAGLRLLATS
jgi:integrase